MRRLIEGRRRWVTLAVGILLLAAGGCAGDGDGSSQGDGPVASSEPDASSPPPTSAPEDDDEKPEVTEEPPAVEEEPPPELQLVGDDYQRVVRSYTSYRTWLFRHPDPERFDNITHPDCECYIQKNLLAHYRDEGLRWTGGKGVQVLQVNVVDEQARNMVHLQVVFERPESGELVDADGTVHDQAEPLEPWVEDLVFLREDQSAPWKLRAFVDRGPLGEGGSGE